jgi:hypothetical protein
MITATSPVPLGPAQPAATAWPAPGAGWAAATAGLAGLLTAFTVTLVGEFPLGELVLFLAAAWAGFCGILNQRLPGPLFHLRFFWVLLAAQAVALSGYALADFSWQSDWHDVARGWARMVFLVVDIVALAYLFGRSRRSLYWMLGGQLGGSVLAVVLFGARFGDVWKFGIGLPATYALIAGASLAGPGAAGLAALGAGLLNFFLDFRSLGGLCLLLAPVVGLQLFGPRLRRWLLPAGLAASLALGSWVYRDLTGTTDIPRANRSDVDRSAMLEAAAEAFWTSPLIGHGSWFSRSHVYDNFMQIRDDRAKEVSMGGFAGPNEEPENVALHSQILVALAEGGLLGGSFFFCYGAGLLWGLFQLGVVRGWHRGMAVRLLLLLLAAWNLLMSPFSGAHRVYIATAAGLLLLLQAESNPTTPTEDAP